MSDSSFTLSNKAVRGLWLNRQGLARTPCTQRETSAIAKCVTMLGMVQLDSIGILARAHHHILWNRQSSYRQPAYDQLLQQERLVFEHFSHDAVILPMSTYPYWQRQHKRRAENYCGGRWERDKSNQPLQHKILSHIEKHGPVCSRDLSQLQTQAVDKTKHAWMRPNHKLALDYLWLSGTLSVSHRSKFAKFYDLSERIIPNQYRQQAVDEQTQINWLCEQALQRLGVASAVEIQRFWEACDLAEVHAWLQQPSMPIMSVRYRDSANKLVNAFAPANLEDQQHLDSTPSSRLRIVNPFDPVIRDRGRLQRLFGFDYRIEIYVPPAKRRYGYYVYPMLEGDRIIGRIDVRANRDADRLDTRAWWLEPGVRHTQQRRAKILQELTRLSKLAAVSEVGPIPTVSPAPPLRL